MIPTGPRVGSGPRRGQRSRKDHSQRLIIGGQVRPESLEVSTDLTVGAKEELRSGRDHSQGLPEQMSLKISTGI